MHILNFPNEILTLLTHHLVSLDSLFVLLQTCRRFYQICSSSRAALPPVFRAPPDRVLLSPHPHLLLAGTARQIADWAVQSESNRLLLLESLSNGPPGLLELAKQISRLSLKDVRTLYSKKARLLNPLARMIEGDCVNYPENGTCKNQEVALLNYWVYCELFHHSTDRFTLGPSKAAVSDDPGLRQPLSPKTRQYFFAHCIGAPWNDDDGLNNLSIVIEMNKFHSPRQELGAFWATGIASTHSEMETWRRAIFFEIMENLGEETLVSLLPGGMSKLRLTADRVKRAVVEMEERDNKKDPGGVHADAHRWTGIQQEAEVARSS